MESKWEAKNNTTMKGLLKKDFESQKLQNRKQTKNIAVLFGWSDIVSRVTIRETLTKDIFKKKWSKALAKMPNFGCKSKDRTFVNVVASLKKSENHVGNDFQHHLRPNTKNDQGGD